MNRLLVSGEVKSIVQRWIDPDTRVIFFGGGWDAASDFAWSMAVNFRNMATGRERTCFLQTIDLALPSHELSDLLREGWLGKPSESGHASTTAT
jgi:hypothetical protein